MIKICTEVNWSDAATAERHGMQHIAELLPTVLARYLLPEPPQVVPTPSAPRRPATRAALGVASVAGLCAEMVNS